jgi:hypothetical protein
VANIPAKLGERDEHLARIGLLRAVAGVAQGRGLGGQIGEVGVAGKIAQRVIRDGSRIGCFRWHVVLPSLFAHRSSL